ncbi:MAG TPA: adenylyl-sulfate kinase [Steroidobacteraceae bacterium]|nr:adenylyl-sulfate kinase [Steroidobacteraceae bacterium]
MGVLDSTVRQGVRRRAGSSSADVVWQESILDRRQRWDCIGQEGATVWFTGLSGAGKSTAAAAVEAHLLAAGRFAYRLDGDNLRHGLCGDLGFTHDDRSENVRRVAELALLFADAGATALVCLISPYAADRAAARSLHERAGIPFIEVYLSTNVEECARRDVKGLYARAESGDLANLTGVAAPYEPPAAPEIEIPAGMDVQSAVRTVLAALG